MPGMMDTVLNLGLNDETVRGLAERTGDERFAYDSYRRFIQAFGEIVLKVPGHLFEEAIEEAKAPSRRRGGHGAFGRGPQRAHRPVQGPSYPKGPRTSFPEDPVKQLELAIKAVFDSWLGARAAAYRREYGIPETLGTAVTVQRMVFGNMGRPRPPGWRSPATRLRGSRASSESFS